MMIVTRSHWLRAQDPEEKSPQHHPHVPWSFPCCLVCSELHARYTDAMLTVVWYELGWTSRCVRTESRLLQSADKSLITRILVKMVAELRNGTPLYSAVDTSCMVVASDPLSWITQWFGVLTWAERPAAAYLATRWKQVRRVPERPSGESLDRLRLTLQTREQHIRLNKATSNVCTAPETNMSAMNAVDHRTDELKTIAKQEELAKLGIDTVLFDVFKPSLLPI